MPEVIEEPTIRTSDVPPPITDHGSPITAGSASLFLPIIDNGQGDIRSNFLLSTLNAFRGRDLHIERFSDSLVPRARNRAACYFLHKTDRDYLMFIDADILFIKDQIDCLMESDEPILAGIYCIKQKGIAPCLNTLQGHVDTPSGGYVKIARAGTGFLRIHRKVFEAMKGPKDATDFDNFVNDWAAYYVNHGQDEWEFFPVGVRNKEYLSEDWWFCDRSRGVFIRRAKELGFAVKSEELDFDVTLDTRIQLRHEGVAIYPLEETIQKHVEENGGKTTVDQAA